MRLSSLALVALLPALAAAQDAPAGVHLAHGGWKAGLASMRAAWKTNSTLPSTCSYGTSANSLTSVANGPVGAQYLDGAGFHHRVLMGNLTAGTTYYYSCGDGTAANSSPVASFTVHPRASSGAPYHSLIMGDWGYMDSQRPGGPMLPVGGLQTNWSASLVRQLMDTQFRAGAFEQVWIVGDIAYADDSFGHIEELLGFGYEETYDGWMDWIENVSSVMPWMVSPGNHESECHSPYCILHLESHGLKLNNFTAFNARWAMPSPESGGVENMWFSWTVEGVHFVSLDTSTDFPDAPEGTTGDSHFPFMPAGHFAPDGAYMAWLEADLAAAVADPDVRWIVAGGHRPFEDLPSAHVTNLTGLFQKYGVSMYFAGHGHSYARYDVSSWGDGTVHIMSGGPGCDEMPYPADQFSVIGADGSAAAGQPSGLESCLQWCTDPAVLAGFTREDAARVQLLHLLQSAAMRNGNETRVRELETVAAAVQAAGDSHGDPCRYCVKAPIYATAKMTMGVLTSTPDALTWNLYLAPGGQLLDTITINHPNATTKAKAGAVKVVAAASEPLGDAVA